MRKSALLLVHAYAGGRVFLATTLDVMPRAIKYLQTNVSERPFYIVHLLDFKVWVWD